MRRVFIYASLFLFTLSTFAQDAQITHPPSMEYRATPEKINDLVHTKLDAKFDYSKSQMNGKVWITLKPHFYPTDSLTLDAKSMDIHKVAMVKGSRHLPLKFNYDGMQLRITLDKTYKGGEKYTIYIDYTAKPNEYKGKGSAAITDAKGLYFINPLGEDKNKPIQIWTQGETEATSVWVPTIDRPNQKTTEEISMTVPAKYITLSNGKLVSQKKNTDGTRTDTWKMDLPHAPYLFFMGVGDYAIIKDKYKDKEVNYYVEKEYAPVARKIFGGTPEMIALFSKLTGVDYPWVKYSQMVARDYVSGAMENTTATLHGESAQQDARQLTDGNQWEEVIAHELFHQWFGDYVTAESWSNITMNESFATLGSQLWNEYKYGKDAAYEERYNSLNGYYGSRSDNKPLVRFHYNQQEDVFDAVSYNKGGGILQMLRHFVGDSAFFKSLNLFLTTHKFKPVEAQQLRLTMEEVTGKDLNWFFNQWYYGAGHPKLNITYDYDAAGKKASMIVQQTQDSSRTFTLPVKVAVWSGNAPQVYDVWVKNGVDTFYFPAATKPSLINFDAAKILVAEKKENKSLDDYLFQYKMAGNYIDRREALTAALRNQAEVTAVEILRLALKDPYAPLRSLAVSGLDMKKEAIKAAFTSTLITMAEKETYRMGKAAAINKLGELKSVQFAPLFAAAVNDSSYTVAGSALFALSQVDSMAAITAAKRLSVQPAKGQLATVINAMLIKAGDEKIATNLLKRFSDMPLNNSKFEALYSIKEFLKVTHSFDLFKQGVDATLAFREKIPDQYKVQIDPIIVGWMQEVLQAQTQAGHKQLADYLASQLK